MAGGLFSRITTRSDGGTIDASNDDAEWDNIINNLLPTKLDDYSLKRLFCVMLNYNKKKRVF